jgi:hypothetical protein
MQSRFGFVPFDLKILLSLARPRMPEPHYLPSYKFDELRAMLRSLPESPGVLRLDCEIPNYPSFFPGGRGYKGQSFPESSVMFIGHNFDTDIGFRSSVERGAEDHLKMKTWVNLRGSFLPGANVVEEECFFTNFYLGAIIHPEPKLGAKRKTTNTGVFKCSQQYRSSCIKALRRQVEIVRPKVIARFSERRCPPRSPKHFPLTHLTVALTSRTSR